jgi:hypothetical protein
MNKKNVLEEIEARIARKKELKTKIVEKNTLKGYVLNFIKNIEELNDFHFQNFYSIARAAKAAKKVLEKQVHTIDKGATIEVHYVDANNLELLCVDQVIITWSKEYQTLNKCEEKTIISSIDAIIF